MPGRAFIPGPLGQAQPRVYKALRGRQLRGLLLAGGGGALGMLLFGATDMSGYSLSFILALPGFAYGYFQPEGKPVEYWLRVVLRYYLTARWLGARPNIPWRHRALNTIRTAVRGLRRARRLKQFEEVCKRGQR